jgi:hypothetical protein
MKSPFAIFRKHQKVAMVVLGILVMFAFVIGDALQNLSSSGMSPQFRAILFAVFGAVVLGGFGYTSGRGKEYALTGFILGAVLGVVVPWYFGPAPAVETQNAGNLTEQELRDLVDRKRIANQFLIAACDSTMLEMDRRMLNFPQARRYLEQKRQQRLGPFYFQDAIEANVLQTFLMNYEAEQMGITVSNDTINDYIRRLTLQQDSKDPTKSNSLTATQFHEILKRMGLSEKEFFDLLREEIKAKMAMELIAPPNLSTPQQFWQSYQKLNVRQQLDAVALDVETFTADIPDPSQGDLTAFFSQHREGFPNQNGPGVPGFRQPRKIRLQYLEADAESAKEEVLKTIDKDLLTSEKRETELKEERERINNAVADVEKKIKDGTIKKKNEIEEKKFAKESELLKLLENGKHVKMIDFEIAKYYQDNREFRYRNRLIPDDSPDVNHSLEDSSFFQNSETSSDEKQTKETQSDSDSSDKQQPSSQKAEDAQQQKDPSPKKQPESEKSKLPASEDKNQSKEDKADGESAVLERSRNVFEVATFLDNADDPDSKSDAKQNTDQKDAPKNREENKSPSVTGKTIEITPARRGPAPPPLPEDPPLPRHRPFDTELKNEIRDELIDQKTTKLVNDQVADAKIFMKELEKQFHEDLDRLRGISRENDEEEPDKKLEDQLRSKISSRLKQFASEKSLVYGETESLSYPEFLEPENQEQYPIASAGVSNSNPLSRMTIIDHVFRSSSEEFSTSLAVADSDNQFAYWKTEDVESFVPKSLAEPGIRDQVLHSWKMEKAREKVQKRAKELAEIVQNSKTEISESLKDETLTGQEGDIKLTVQPTESFSWLETGLQDPSDPFGQPTVEIWDLSTIEKTGNDFMRIVFEELQDGEVGVAPNADQSIYYVVKVKNRSTSVPGSMGALRQGFRAEKFNVIYSNDQQTTASNWSRRFYEEKYKLQRNRPESNR